MRRGTSSEEPPPATAADYGIELTPQSDTTGQPDISTGTDVPPLPVTYFSDIRAVYDARDFVQGTLTERASSVVYGESNAGKTFWATDLALHVAYALTGTAEASNKAPSSIAFWKARWASTTASRRGARLIAM